MPYADSSSYPGGVGATSVLLTDLTSSVSGPNILYPSRGLPDYVYNATDHTLWIENLAVLTNVKHLSLQMDYTGGHIPQEVGEVFNQALWPTLTDPVTAVVTGAAVMSNGISNSLYMTWDIIPQPDSETIYLDFPALEGDVHVLEGDFGGVFMVKTGTICTVPEPSTIMLLGFGMIGFGYAVRSKALFVA